MPFALLITRPLQLCIVCCDTSVIINYPVPGIVLALRQCIVDAFQRKMGNPSEKLLISTVHNAISTRGDLYATAVVSLY